VDPEAAIQALLGGLGALQIGDRLWYWLCPEPAPGYPPLLVAPLWADPDMALLTAASAGIPLQLGAQPAIGLGAVAADGALELGGPLLDDAALEELAAWCTEQVDRHPALSLLWGTRLVVLEQGRARERISRDDAWAWVPRGRMPGTPEDTHDQLSRLKTDEGAWFWLSRDAQLVVRPRSEDPDGEAFARLVTALGAESLVGIAWSRDTLLLTTEAPVSGWHAVLQTASENNPALAGARLISQGTP